MNNTRSILVKGKEHPLTPAPEWASLQGDETQKFFDTWTRDSVNSDTAFSAQERMEMLEAAQA